MKRTMPRREVLPAGYCWQRRALVGGDSGTKRGSLAPGCARATGRHLGPTGVWSTARLDSTAAKVGKVPRVAESDRTRGQSEEAWHRGAHEQPDGTLDPPAYGRRHVWTARQRK